MMVDKKHDDRGVSDLCPRLNPGQGMCEKVSSDLMLEGGFWWVLPFRPPLTTGLSRGKVTRNKTLYSKTLCPKERWGGAWIM